MQNKSGVLSNTQTTRLAHHHAITWRCAEKCDSKHTLCVTWSIAYCQNSLVNRKMAIVVKLILHVGIE